MSFTVERLVPPLPDPSSRDARDLLALEAATQDRPLTLASLLAEATPDVPGVVLLARPPLRSEVQGALVGMASARLLGDGAHVMRLAVDAEHRRRGIGALLLDGLIAWADEHGAPLLLEVRDGNVAARSLYARAGFTVDGRRRRYYPDGEDALLLSRAPVTVGGG